MANHYPSWSDSRGRSESRQNGFVVKRESEPYNVRTGFRRESEPNARSEVKMEFEPSVRSGVKREFEPSARTGVKREYEPYVKEEYHSETEYKFKPDPDYDVKQEFGYSSGPKFGSRSDYGANNFRASAKKTQKDTFFCQVCKVELNSIETRQTHIAGRRHKENVERNGDRYEATIISIRNPSPIRRKIVEDLVTKLMKTEIPAIGLDRVKEYIPIFADKDMEPYYECEACSTLGDANALFNHISGKVHREQILGYKNESKLRQAATAKRENEKARELIETIKGDNLYPWPPGKAPWSLEQGGNGVAPPGARGRFGCETSRGPFQLSSRKSFGAITKRNSVYFTDIMKAVNSRVTDYFDHGLQDEDDDNDDLDPRQDLDSFSNVLTSTGQEKIVKSEAVKMEVD